MRGFLAIVLGPALGVGAFLVVMPQLNEVGLSIFALPCFVACLVMGYVSASWAIQKLIGRL